MKNIKKYLALVLGFVMLFSLLAGCGATNDEPTVPGSNNYDVPEIAGTILLNANACVEISFDKDGKVLNVQEADHDGHELLADFSGYLGVPCAEVVKDLVTASCNMELLNSEHNHIVIKEKPGSTLPGETFLTDLATAAEEASEIYVTTTVITAAEQDADGNILAKKAYDVLQNALNIDKFNLVESNEELTDGVYTFNVEAYNITGVYLVEAATGYVYEGSFETEYPDMNETEAHEANVEDATTETTVPLTSEEDTQPQQTASQEETAPIED